MCTACATPKLSDGSSRSAFSPHSQPHNSHPRTGRSSKTPPNTTAYTAAVNTQDATARAEALEAFVQQYPKSVVLTNALEEEMAAWQAAGDSKQVMRVAKRLLAADAGNVRALGIVVALDRVNAGKGDLDALNEMCQYASGGMLAVPMWRQPANMSPADYDSLSKLLSAIFIGAEGYCAVQEKNFSQARDWLGRALKIDPTNVQDTYQLAVADLESTPVDADGFWFCARGIHLAQSAAIPQDAGGMTAYCRSQVHHSTTAPTTAGMPCWRALPMKSRRHRTSRRRSSPRPPHLLPRSRFPFRRNSVQLLGVLAALPLLDLASLLPVLPYPAFLVSLVPRSLSFCYI